MVKFTKNEIEALAEMEHARWNVERLLAGWKHAETKDVGRKLSPYLVSWANLSDEIRELDRNTVRAIPELLAQTRLEIYRRV